MKPDSSKQKIYWGRILAAIIVCSITIYGIGASITGLVVFKEEKQLQLEPEGENAVQKVLEKTLEKQIQSYSEKLLECQSSIKSLEIDLKNSQNNCESSNLQLKEQIKKQEQKLQEYYKQKEETILSDTENIELELEEHKKQLKDLQSHYDLVVESSARNICCVKQFDNPNILFYEVINDKISCSEQGGEPLDCSLN